MTTKRPSLPPKMLTADAAGKMADDARRALLASAVDAAERLIRSVASDDAGRSVNLLDWSLYVEKLTPAQTRILADVLREHGYGVDYGRWPFRRFVVRW